MLKTASIVALAIALSPMAVAATVHIQVVSGGNQSRDVTVALIPGDTAGDTRLVEAKLNSPFVADLPGGVWYVEVRDAALWHQREAFFAGGAMDVTTRVWPRATMTGRLRGGHGPLPSELLVYVQSQSDGPSGESVCALTDDRFSCPVPAGAFDARIRARGFVAAHYPALQLAPGQTLDAGTMELRRGSSIVGRVEALPADMPSVRVSATVTTPAREKPRPITATPAASGLFHLDGIAPGEYTIEALLTTDRRTRPVSVIVQRDSEIELGTPLVIQRRKPLRLVLAPPRQPSGDAWTVQIDEQTARGQLETVERRLAGDDGRFLSAALAPGEYVVSVRTEPDGVWYRQTIEVSDDAPQLAIDLPVLGVKGTVTLKDMPLAAELRFLANESDNWVTLQSDQEGKFSGFLPASGTQRWAIRVRAPEPRTMRTFHDVEIDGEHAVDLRIPLTVLSGRVTGPDGNAVWPAMVNIRTAGESIMQSTPERDGSFAVHGLPPGRYRLSATAPDMQSQTVEVAIPEDPMAESQTVVLVLENERELHGTVTWRLGPVAGASVQVTPVDATPALGIFFRTTDANGRFKDWLPPNTRVVDIHVAAPGLSYSTQVRQLTGSDLPIVVDDRSGTLTVTLRGKEVRPVLFHNGSVIEVRTLIDRWTGQERIDGDRRSVVIPQMEPGSYTLCVVPAAAPVPPSYRPGPNCTAATLPPFGAVTLARE